jgi:RND family efflux transporter MFP subunit
MFLTPIIPANRRLLLVSAAVLLFLLAGAALPARAQISVTAVIRAEDEVVVRSEFPGIVERIAVREGDTVSEGQLLIELRNARQKINLDLAQAGVVKAEAAMKETEVVLESAERELNRVKMAGNAVPRKDVEEKEDLVRRLRSNLQVQAAAIAEARQEVRLREQELGETRLNAPFNATVTQIFINRGDTLRPLETQIIELVALEPLYAEVLLPSSYAERVRKDQKIRVDVESESMARVGRVEGTVIYVNPKIDAASRTFKVKIEIPNPTGRVRPGMLAQVRVEFQ